VLQAGLAGAAWISVDDTGARHQGRNATCTQIGNEHFAWFATTGSKSRLNFLELLRAGHTDYVINAEALAYMRQRALPQHAIARLANHPDKHFADEQAWSNHLQRLGFHDIKHRLDPPRLATEGALWGAIKAHGLLLDTLILSDDAGQFRGRTPCPVLGACERLVHKLDTFCDPHRKAQNPHPIADLALLRRSQGLQATALTPPQGSDAGALRPHLQTPHRLCHARPAAGQASRQ
jgi:hypothetical protein